MTEPKAPRDLFIVTFGDSLPPGVMESKDSADMIADMTNRSNRPNVIHTREVTGPDYKSIAEIALKALHDVSYYSIKRPALIHEKALEECGKSACEAIEAARQKGMSSV